MYHMMVGVMSVLMSDVSLLSLPITQFGMCDLMGPIWVPLMNR